MAGVSLVMLAVLYFQEDSVLVVHVRCGAVHGCTFSDLGGASVDDFLLNRYATRCPEELIVNHVSNPLRLEQQLTTAVAHRVRVTVAAAGRRGTAQRLMLLAALNHAYRAAPRSDARTSTTSFPEGVPAV